jgi:hypothetical protein
VGNPELLYVTATNFDPVPYDTLTENPWIPKREVGSSIPVPAWEPDYNFSARPGPAREAVAVETGVVKVLRAQYEAFEWLQHHKAVFPIIKNGP